MRYFVAIIFFGWLGFKAGRYFGISADRLIQFEVYYVAGLVALFVCVGFLGLFADALLAIGSILAILLAPFAWIFRRMRSGPAVRRSGASANFTDEWVADAGNAQNDDGAEFALADLCDAYESPVRVEQARVFIQYRDEIGTASERVIDIIGFVPNDEATYRPIQRIAAWCELRRAYRTFRVDRIGAAADPDTGEVIEDVDDWIRQRAVRSQRRSRTIPHVIPDERR